MTVKVLRLWDPKPEGFKVITTVSKSATGAERGLSPFVLGPCPLYGRYVSRNMENAWQYAKVYKEHLNARGGVGKQYWPWAKEGWGNERAVRYPMGKGRRPEFSLWDGEHLTYVEARKAVYGPLYAEAVLRTDSWRWLRRTYKQEKDIVLLDYDAYDHEKLGMTLTDVLNNPDKKMGHAFVLAMLLTDDPALKQMRMR